jgi:hypothetical protein
MASSTPKSEKACTAYPKLVESQTTASPSKFLEPFGYLPAPITPGLWCHTTRDIAFALVVDDFGVKYTKCADTEHLMTTLNKQYKVSEDWNGTRYCSLTLKWYYDKRTCDISMPGYIERALQQ